MEQGNEDEKVLFVSGNINSLLETIGWCFVMLMTIIFLIVMIIPDKTSSIIANVIKTIIGAPFALYCAILFIDTFFVRIVVTNHGIRKKYLLSLIKNRSKSDEMSWESIEKVIVYLDLNGLSIKDTYIVGRHPLSIIYDEKQGINQIFYEPRPLDIEPKKWWKLYTPYHRPLMRIRAGMKDINELLTCLKELVPEKIYMEKNII